MVRKARAVGRKPTRTTIEPATQPSQVSKQKNADGLYPDNECYILPLLSPEIWELILDNVDDRATLYNLCRTNRRFYNSTIARLYRQLAVSANSVNKIPRLIRTLEPLLSIQQRKKLRTEGQYTGQRVEYPSGLDEDEAPACAIYVREFVVGLCSPGRKHIYIVERYLEEALKNMPNLRIVQTSVLTASIARSIASLKHLQALCVISDGSSIRHAKPLKRLRNLRHLSVIEGFAEDGTEPWQTIIANSSSTLQSLEQCTGIYDIDDVIGIGCNEQGQYALPLVKLNYLKISGIWNHERRVDSVLESINFLNLQQLTINHDNMEGSPVARLVPRLISVFEAAMATTESISLTNLTIKVDQLDQIELWTRYISSFASLKRLEVLNYGNYNDGHLHHPDLSPDLLGAICKHQNLSHCIFSRDWRAQSRYPKFSPGTIRMLVDSLPLLQEVAFYVAEQDLTEVMSGLTRAKNLTNLRLDPVTYEDEHGFCLPPDKALDKMLDNLVEIAFREAMPHLQSGDKLVWEQYSALKYIALGHYRRWELASTFTTIKNAKEKRKKLVAKTDNRFEVWTRRVSKLLPERDIGCENKLELCYRGNYYQDLFDRGIELWESLCRSYVTFSPTTPSAEPYTVYPEQLCVDVDKACQTARNILSDCLPYVSDTDTSRLSSCECQPRLLRQAYTCQYIGNASCLATEAATTNAYGYGICDNFGSVIGAEHSATNEPAQTNAEDLPTLSASTRETLTITASQTSTETSSISSQVTPRVLLMLSIMAFTIAG